MTELEKRVKELRNKYEGPIRKYLGASKVLDAAFWNTVDLHKKSELIKLDMKLFPIGAMVAARCAADHMDCLDGSDVSDVSDVRKSLFVRSISNWKTEMEKLEI